MPVKPLNFAHSTSALIISNHFCMFSCRHNSLLIFNLVRISWGLSWRCTDSLQWRRRKYCSFHCYREYLGSKVSFLPSRQAQSRMSKNVIKSRRNLFRLLPSQYWLFLQRERRSQRLLFLAIRGWLGHHDRSYFKQWGDHDQFCPCQLYSQAYRITEDDNTRYS